VSSQPPSRDPDTEPITPVGTSERKRAALALLVLGVAAVVLVVVMVYVFGSSNDNNGPSSAANPTVGGPAVTVTGDGSAPPPHTAASHPHTHKATKSNTPTPNQSSYSGPVSCPTSAPCTLPQDVGDVIGAVNDFRTQHGAKPVPGSVTPAARKCVASHGDQSSCPSGYFWEPVGRSGAQVVSKIARASDGTSWLLDRSMRSVAVGWLYIPSTHSYECAVISQH
jgi:hypothetical protein